MKEQQVIQSNNQWTEQIAELKKLLDEVKPLLVAAEAQLSERLAEISAFEFKVRVRLEKLTARLEKLDEEIKTLRRQLNILKEGILADEYFPEGSLYEKWRSSEEAGAAASGEYRYRRAAEAEQAAKLTADQSSEIKHLYRQLARRFHPDFALDDADRDYRTAMMMAINTAYAAGDVEKLKELALEPDPQQREYTNQQLAEALLKEWDRCRRRMDEIDGELENLENHPSAQLMRQADRLTQQGRDMLDELATDLGNKITHHLVQRDMLQHEIRSFGKENLNLGGDDFADAVYDLGLEEVLVEDPDSAFQEWRDKNWGRYDFDDSGDDGVWEELRKQRNRNKK